MKKKILAALLLAAAVMSGAVSQPAAAQTSLAVDISKAKLTWQFAQGTGGAPDQFNVKCGTSSKNYTKTTVISASVQTANVDLVINGFGNWFCVVTASNGFGESGPTNEVSFLAGAIPVSPTSLVIQAN